MCGRCRRVNVAGQGKARLVDPAHTGGPVSALGWGTSRVRDHRPLLVALPPCSPIALRIAVAHLWVPAPTARMACPGGKRLHPLHVSVLEVSRCGKLGIGASSCCAFCAPSLAAASCSLMRPRGTMSLGVMGRLVCAAQPCREASRWHGISLPDCRPSQIAIHAFFSSRSSTYTNQLYAFDGRPCLARIPSWRGLLLASRNGASAVPVEEGG